LNVYQYPDFFQYSRGYDSPLADDVYRVGLNYQLPALYPDVGALGIYYLKRIRLNPFFDHGRYNLAQLRDAQTINSAGLQVIFDGTLFNLGDVTFGMEFSRRLNNHAFGPQDKGTPSFRFLAATFLASASWNSSILTGTGTRPFTAHWILPTRNPWRTWAQTSAS